MIPTKGLIGRAFDSKMRGAESKRGQKLMAAGDKRSKAIARKAATGVITAAQAQKRLTKTKNVTNRKLIRIGVKQKNPTASRAGVTSNTRRQARKYRRYYSGSVIRPA